MSPMPSSAISTRPAVNEISAAPAARGSLAATGPGAGVPAGLVVHGRAAAGCRPWARGADSCRRTRWSTSYAAARPRRWPASPPSRSPVARARSRARRLPRWPARRSRSTCRPRCRAIRSRSKVTAVPPTMTPGLNVSSGSCDSRSRNSCSTRAASKIAPAPDLVAEDLRRVTALARHLQRPPGGAAACDDGEARIAGAVLEADRDVGGVGQVTQRRAARGRAAGPRPPRRPS